MLASDGARGRRRTRGAPDRGRPGPARRHDGGDPHPRPRAPGDHLDAHPGMGGAAGDGALRRPGAGRGAARPRRGGRGLGRAALLGPCALGGRGGRALLARGGPARPARRGPAAGLGARAGRTPGRGHPRGGAARGPPRVDRGPDQSGRTDSGRGGGDAVPGGRGRRPDRPRSPCPRVQAPGGAERRGRSRGRCGSGGGGSPRARRRGPGDHPASDRRARRPRAHRTAPRPRRRPARRPSARRGHRAGRRRRPRRG